jgi:hypothetical protein
MNDVRIGPALEELVADLPEVDLAQAAWREADVRRLARRRRALVAFVASVAVVVGLGALWVEAGEGDSRGMQQVPAQSVPPDQPIRVPSRTVPTSPPAASQTTPWVDPAGWKVAGDGVWRIGLIDVTRYRDLPTFAGPLGRMAGAASTDLSRLPANESASPASALYLERDPANADGSEYRPVVLAAGRRIRVDAVTLKPLRERLPGGSRAISADGSALVFPQPSRVVIVDLVTRSVHRIVVPDPDLETAGWSVSDPGEVIARSPGRAWRVDLATRTVGPAGPQDVDSRFEVRSRDSGGTTELVLDRVTPAGMTTTSLGRDLGAPVSESVSARGRVALATLGSTGSSAIVVADTGAGPTGRGAVKVLTVQFGIGFPLGWDPSGRYLHFEAGAGGGTYVLVWDVSTGGVYRAARASSDIGTPVPIALGAGYGRQ